MGSTQLDDPSNSKCLPSPKDNCYTRSIKASLPNLTLGFQFLFVEINVTALDENCVYWLLFISLL